MMPSSFYIYWGWATPNGSFIWPKKSQRDLEHGDILPATIELKGIEDYINDGYIRFFYESSSNTLFLETSLVFVEEIGKDNFVKHISKILDNIETLTLSGKLEEIFDRPIPLPREVFLDITKNDKVAYVKSLYDNFINKLRNSLDSAISTLYEALAIKLYEKEKFNPKEYYYMFGWINDSGEIVLPEIKDDGLYQLHIDMVKDYGFRSEVAARSKGWVRFAYEINQNILFFEAEREKPKKENLIRGLKTLENDLYSERLNKYFGREIPIPPKIIFEMAEGYGFKRRLYTFNSIDETIAHFRTKPIVETHKPNLWENYFIKYYYFHGWVDPNGNIILPKMTPNGPQCHAFILEDYGLERNEYNALLKGWVRFYMAKNKKELVINAFTNKRHFIKSIKTIEEGIYTEKFKNVYGEYTSPIPLPKKVYVTYDRYDRVGKSFNSVDDAIRWLNNALVESRNIILNEINFFVKLFGIIHKDAVITSEPHESVHDQIWKRVGDVRGEYLQLEWLLDFDDALYIRLTLPKNVNIQNIPQKYQKQNLEAAYRGVKALLNTIPYDELRLETISYDGIYERRFRSLELLNYLKQIFNLGA